jgi:hypothetical protein
MKTLWNFEFAGNGKAEGNSLSRNLIRYAGALGPIYNHGAGGKT